MISRSETKNRMEQTLESVGAEAEGGESCVDPRQRHGPGERVVVQQQRVQ